MTFKIYVAGQRVDSNDVLNASWRNVSSVGRMRTPSVERSNECVHAGEDDFWKKDLG